MDGRRLQWYRHAKEPDQPDSLTGSLVMVCLTPLVAHLQPPEVDLYEPLGADGMWTKRGPGMLPGGAAALRLADVAR